MVIKRGYITCSPSLPLLLFSTFCGVRGCRFACAMISATVNKTDNYHNWWDAKAILMAGIARLAFSQRQFMRKQPHSYLLSADAYELLAVCACFPFS